MKEKELEGVQDSSIKLKSRSTNSTGSFDCSDAPLYRNAKSKVVHLHCRRQCDLRVEPEINSRRNLLAATLAERLRTVGQLGWGKLEAIISVSLKVKTVISIKI